jgi:hypothetical protein
MRLGYPKRLSTPKRKQGREKFGGDTGFNNIGAKINRSCAEHRNLERKSATYFGQKYDAGEKCKAIHTFGIGIFQSPAVKTFSSADFALLIATFDSQCLRPLPVN